MIPTLKSKKNISEEIAEQYKNYITLGVLTEGEKLPSVRELAIQLGINPNTVERAYTMLEASNHVIALPKKGFFVVGLKNNNNKNVEILTEAKYQIMVLKALGLELNELLATVKEVYSKEDK